MKIVVFGQRAKLHICLNQAIAAMVLKDLEQRGLTVGAQSLDAYQGAERLLQCEMTTHFDYGGSVSSGGEEADTFVEYTCDPTINGAPPHTYSWWKHQADLVAERLKQGLEKPRDGYVKLHTHWVAHCIPREHAVELLAFFAAPTMAGGDA